MSSEEKILSILETMQVEQRNTNERLDRLERKVDDFAVELTAVKHDLAEVKHDLTEVKRDLAGVKHEQAGMRLELIEIKDTLGDVFEHAVRLTEQQTLIERSIKDLASVTEVNTLDIVKLRAAK